MRRMMETLIEITAEVGPVGRLASDVAENGTGVRLRMEVAYQWALKERLRSQQRFLRRRMLEVIISETGWGWYAVFSRECASFTARESNDCIALDSPTHRAVITFFLPIRKATRSSPRMGISGFSMYRSLKTGMS